MNAELERLTLMRTRLSTYRLAEAELLGELIVEVRAMKSAMHTVLEKARTQNAITEAEFVKLHSAATRSDFLEMLLTAWQTRAKEGA